jgi:hypothetical protein
VRVEHICRFVGTLVPRGLKPRVTEVTLRVTSGLKVGVWETQFLRRLTSELSPLSVGVSSLWFSTERSGFAVEQLPYVEVGTAIALSGR